MIIDKQNKKTDIMKKLTFIILAALAVSYGTARAQGNASDECAKYASFYAEAYKAKDYEKALTNWRKTYELCPRNYRQNIYVHGAKLINDEIARNVKNGNKELAKAQYDTLLTLLDQRLQYYPTAKKGGVVVENKYELLNNKGNYIINYSALNDDDPKYLLDNLSTISSSLEENTAPSILVNELKAAVALYREDKVDAEKVIETYEKVAGFISNAPAKNDAEAEENRTAKGNIDLIFADSKVATCENLIAIFTPRFEATPDDIGLVTNIVKLMNSADDCAGNDLYLKAVTTLHRTNPSHTSAYSLYRLNSALGKTADAGRFLDEAIAASDVDDDSKAKYQYELALYAYKNGMRGKAQDAARRAVELDRGYAGKAYLILGNLWASTSCSGDVDKYARYWAATDYYQKARSADPSVADEASSSIASVSRYYPPASEIFMYDLTAGQSYTVSCGGLSATTTVRVSR